MVLESSTSACDAFDVSISGASAVTVIDLLDGADFEGDVERDELLRADADALPLEGLEPLHRGLDRVDDGIERRERVLARRVRDRVARHAVGLVDERDRDAGDHALRVLDRPAHAALKRLRRGQPGRNPEHTDTDDGCARSCRNVRIPSSCKREKHTGNDCATGDRMNWPNVTPIRRGDARRICTRRHRESARLPTVPRRNWPNVEIGRSEKSAISGSSSPSRWSRPGRGCRRRPRPRPPTWRPFRTKPVPNFFKNPPGIYTGENMGIATNSKGNIYIYHRANETRLFEYSPQGAVHPRDRPQQLRLRVRAFGARRRPGQHLGGRRRHRHARQVQPRGQGADDHRPPRGSGRDARRTCRAAAASTAATRSTASAARPTSPSISRATSSSPTATSTGAW